MNINMYVINAILILMVVRQVREHPLDLRSLAVPVLAVGCAAVLFLHSVPAGGNDVVLELTCVLVGAVMGAVGGLATRLRLGADGRPLGQAGWLAASMWVGGVGARLAFAVAASNGAGPAIARFSVTHHITGSAAWVAALIMMALADVLTRLVIIYLRGRRLANPAASVVRTPAGHTGFMQARPDAAGLTHDAARDEPGSARVAEARSRARERRDAQRQALRPLGVLFIAVVVTASAQTHPAPGLRGAGLGVLIALAVYAAAVVTALSVGWARRGPAAQAAVSLLIGGCGVTLAVLQPNGPVEIAASMGVWIAAVRLPPVPAAAVAGAITIGLATAVGLTARPAAQSAITATLLCLLLAVTGQFIRRGRESQDHTELLLAQLQDAREGEAAAAALAERSRIAGELHDVLAHSLSGLAIQLQGARKLAAREAVSDGLRAAIERSAELTESGLADARQAVGALRGDRLPGVDQMASLVEDFRRDTGADATLRVEGESRSLPAEASLALFRGAQEALTNIARYAPGAVTAVTVTYQADRTVVTIEDRVSGPQTTIFADAGGGHGLTAMRERVARAGGAVRAGPTADGWRVELEVPT